MRIIKKYKNRIMYDTHTSKPVTLRQLAQLLSDNISIRILDNATGRDITRLTMLQTMLDLEKAGHGLRDLLPTFLSWSVRSSQQDFRTSLSDVLHERRSRSAFEADWSSRLVGDAISAGIVGDDKAGLLNEAIHKRLGELYEEIVNQLDSHVAEKTKIIDRLLVSVQEHESAAAS